MFTRDQLKLFDALGGISKRSDVPLYVVGGVLRDIFLGEDVVGKDIDFVVEGNAIDFAQQYASNLGGELQTFPDFYSAKLVRSHCLQAQEEVDLASARTEIYKKSGALPTVSLASIKEDLCRRDFTVNAMAIRIDRLLKWIAGGDGKLNTLYREVLDPFKGRADLDKLIIRTLHPRSFLDDPTRIFRASRYVTRIGGKLESATEKELREAIAAGALDTVSHDRKFGEIKRIFRETRPERALRFLFKAEVFNHFDIFPAEYAEEFFLLIKKIGDFNTRRSDDFMYNLATRIFFYFSSFRQDEEYLKKFGFGRKQLRQFKKDLEDSRTIESPKDLSAEALVLALAWDENRNIHDELAREGRQRGLIVCSI